MQSHNSLPVYLSMLILLVVIGCKLGRLLANTFVDSRRHTVCWPRFSTQAMLTFRLLEAKT